MSQVSAGARFRAAVQEEAPLQVMGAITAYAGLMAKRIGYKALYLSGGGVAANSLGMPDLGISTMEDVLTDARRIVDATGMPLLVDIDTGWGGAFNIGRTIRNFERIGVAAVHMEDQVGQKRCGHRPGKEVVSKDEMVDRVKAAVDGRIDDPLRVHYFRTHLAAVAEAISQGADVRGYCAWSLFDNLEWAHGFSKRFGLVHVDFETQQRTLKASARYYASVIAGGPL